MAVDAGGPEAVGDEEGDQRAPEDGVQDDGGSDPLGTEGEPGSAPDTPDWVSSR